MISKTIFVIFLIAFIGITGFFLYLYFHKSTTVSQVITPQVAKNALSPTPIPTVLPAGNSNAQLNQDVQSIDDNLNALDQNITGVTQNINLQQTNLQ